MPLLSRSRKALLPVLALAALVSVVAAPAAHAQTSYDVLFDNTFNNSTTPPIVGFGTFNFTNDLGLGTFAYDALGPVNFTFNIDGRVFTQNDIVSDTSQTTVVFTSYNGGRRLRFSDTGNGAGGPNSGSLDLENSTGGFLTFEPSYFGEGLNRYQSSSYDGSYLATAGTTVAAVPEPSEWAGMGTASFALCGLMIKARRRAKASTSAKC